MIDVAASKLNLRDAQLDDAEQIAAIYQPYVLQMQSSYEYVAPSVDTMRERIAQVQQHGLPWLVAYSDQRILGYCYATAYRQREGYRYVVEDAIYVDQNYLGKGVGKTLLSTLIDRCTQLGKRQMLAVIGDAEKNVASIQLHERCGFEKAGLLRGIGYKHGRWLDN